jgi:hypothetical protein
LDLRYQGERFGEAAERCEQVAPLAIAPDLYFETCSRRPGTDVIDGGSHALHWQVVKGEDDVVSKQTCLLSGTSSAPWAHH